MGSGKTGSVGKAEAGSLLPDFLRTFLLRSGRFLRVAPGALRAGCPPCFPLFSPWALHGGPTGARRPCPAVASPADTSGHRGDGQGPRREQRLLCRAWAAEAGRGQASPVRGPVSAALHARTPSPLEHPGGLTDHQGTGTQDLNLASLRTLLPLRARSGFSSFPTTHEHHPLLC